MGFGVRKRREVGVCEGIGIGIWEQLLQNLAQAV